MNQIIKMESINFSKLVKNNTLSLSTDAQSDMIDFLNKEFTEEQSKRYIINLYMYLHFHPTTDFPINLEHVYRDLGFANKGNAMKTIKSNFTVDEDYKLIIIPREKKQNAGRSEHEIMLNIDTYKTLCMLVKTSQGKEIRKYYVKLENIYNKIIKKEIEQQKLLQENTQKLLEQKEKELTQTKKQLEQKTKLKVKKWYDSCPGHIIYAVKSSKDDTNSLVTIGKTKNIKDRERNYFTHNQNGEMFYMKKCYNCDLAEHVIHHILDKYRVENNKEWFDISNELTTYTIDIVCDFLDKFINFSEELPKSNIKENLNISLELIKNLSNEIKLPIENNLCIKQQKEIDIHIDYNDPTDFDKFVKEYCELGETEEYFTSPYDLLGAFRMWCRGALCTKDIRHRFSLYMKEKFVFKDKFIADYGSRFQLYLGIRPKKLQFKPENENNLTKYEEFFNDKCHVGYTFRIRYSTFIDTYKEWLENTYPTYNYTKDHAIELKAYFNKKFLITTIPGIKSIGLWGCQLKTDQAPKYGLQTRKRKVVLQIDVNSKEITNTYESLIEASEHLKISNRTLSDYIIKSKVFDFENKKFLLKYKDV